MSDPVVITSITAVASVLVGLITRPSRKAQEHAKEAADLMRGNGHGTVPVMLETILEKQAKHEVDDMVRFAFVNATMKALREEKEGNDVTPGDSGHAV